MDFVRSSSNIPSLTGLDDGPADFNYDFDAFIQDEDIDIDYLAGESSGSSNMLSDGPSPSVVMNPPLAPVAPVESSFSVGLPLAATCFSKASPGTMAKTQNLVRSGLDLTRVTGAASTSPSTSTSTSLSKQRMERRGHTKSRRGCFNCKRRRIKCQETKPACAHCIKTGLNCEYPTVPQVVHQPQHQIPIFSIQDMRLFQHFLFQCYPHHPIGSESLWTHEIPCLSQKYEYLMHAILGFSASELMPSDPSLIESAMAHRLKAIRAIKKTLTDVPKTNNFEEGNALMATCFALTFQSVSLNDGMAEYMTFIRGILIVGYQMYIKGARLIFGDFLGDRQNERLEPHMRKVPLIDGAWTDTAVTAIKGLEPLVFPPTVVLSSGNSPDGDNNDDDATSINNINTKNPRKTEAKYYEMILDMAEKTRVSSWEAYQALSAHYGWWMTLPHDQFERVVDPGNQVSVLLATHWIALKQIMATITETESKAFTKRPEEGDPGGGGGGGESNNHDMDVGIIRWLKFLNRSVDADHVRYNAWPVWVEEQLDRDRGFFGSGKVRCGKL